MNVSAQATPQFGIRTHAKKAAHQRIEIPADIQEILNDMPPDFFEKQNEKRREREKGHQIQIPLYDTPPQPLPSRREQPPAGREINPFDYESY